MKTKFSGLKSKIISEVKSRENNISCIRGHSNISVIKKVYYLKKFQIKVKDKFT